MIIDSFQKSADTTPTLNPVGVNSASMQEMSSALTATPVYGQTHILSEVYFTSSKEKFIESLSLSASAKANYRLVSGSATADLVKKMNIEENNLVVVVSAQKYQTVTWQNNPQFGTNVTIPTEDNAPSQTNFFLQYGDSFITRQKLGARFFGCYIFKSKTRNEQLEIESTFSASKGKIGGSTEAEFKSALDQVSTSYQFEFLLEGYTATPPSKVSEVFEQITTVSGATIGDESVYFGHELACYNQLMTANNFNMIYPNQLYFSTEALTISSNGTTITKTYYELDTLLKNSLAQAQRLSSAYTFYNYTETGNYKVAAFITSISQALADLRAQVNAYSLNPTTAVSVPASVNTALAHGIPSLGAIAYTTSDQFGTYHSAYTFEDVSTDEAQSYFLDRRLVTSVNIQGDFGIYKLTRTIVNTQTGDVDKIVSGITNKGKVSATLSLDAQNNRCTQIQAYSTPQYGGLCGLTITAGSKSISSGIEENPPATPASPFNLAAGDILMGFSGSFGMWIGQWVAITSIGCIVGRITPTVWSTPS